jgi:hypothetical protein
MRTSGSRARNAALLSALAIASTQCAPSNYQSPSPPSLAPDLNLRISCLEEHDAAFEVSALDLLKSSGIEALNISQLRREHLESERSTRVYSVQVIGLTSNANAMVDFVRLSNFEDEFVYHVTLFTHPPTSRADDIETSLERFATEFATSPTCRIASTERSQNGPESSELFEEIYAIKRNWFKQASAL